MSYNHKKTNKIHRNAATGDHWGQVKFCLSEAIEGSALEALLKSHDEPLVEMVPNIGLKEIAHPNRGTAYAIEYDGADRVALTGCAWLSIKFLNRGCRVFASKNRFFITTFMSIDEVINIICELMPTMGEDAAFWKMLNIWNEMYA